MHQSIPDVPTPPPPHPGPTPGHYHFFWKKMGKFPGVGTHEMSKCPEVGTKQEGKCPAPEIAAFQHFYSFILIGEFVVL